MVSKKQKTPPSPTEEPSPLDIARLAARLLPPIELPPNWATEHHLNLQRILAEATTGKGRNVDRSYEYPAGWPTQFEVVAEEATRRARILLDAAVGRIRPERLAYERSGEEADQKMAQFAEASASKEREFERHAKGHSSLPIMEALRIALPRVYKHQPENAYRYWQDYLRTSVIKYRRKHGLPELPVRFRSELEREEVSHPVDSDSTQGPPHVVVLNHDDTYQVTRREYGVLAILLPQFHKSPEAAQLRSVWFTKAGKKGGKNAQDNNREEGDLSHADTRALDAAAKKVQNKSKGA
ncbi:MAG: hypothetical protein ACKV19_11700 [Verrucomicrobiales bacterium]